VSLLKKNYIPLLIYNSDELVMSRGNQKNFTYAFCKSEALNFPCFGLLLIFENGVTVIYGSQANGVVWQCWLLVVL
jgi:hypothetical protein